MRKLLVRADDFGFSEGINHGIAKTVNDGIIRNIGLMPNMDAAPHGVELLKNERICWGQHTNICVGRPLTDPERLPSLVDGQGNFKTADVYRNAGSDIVNTEEAVLEIEAQYHRFTELVGDKPHYFEGHALFNPHFLKALGIVAEKYDLPVIRFRPSAPARFRNTELIMFMDSMSPGYDPYAVLKKAAMAEVPDGAVPMMVCHPGYIDAYLLEHGLLVNPRPREAGMLSDPTVKHWLKEQNICLVTYDDLI